MKEKVVKKIVKGMCKNMGEKAINSKSTFFFYEIPVPDELKKKKLANK